MQWSDWDSFTFNTTASNNKPTLTISNLTMSNSNRSEAVRTFVSYNDADHDEVVKYEIKDTAGPNSQKFFNTSHFYSDTPVGAIYNASNGVVITASEFASLGILRHASAGTQTDLQIRAFDGTDWSDWTSFTLTTTHNNTKPVVNVGNINLNINEQKKLWDILKQQVHYTDADGDNWQDTKWNGSNIFYGLKYEVKDTTGSHNFIDGNGNVIDASNGYEFTIRQDEPGKSFLKRQLWINTNITDKSF